MDQWTARPDAAEWVTPAKAAALLGVTPGTLANYADAGLIASFLLPTGHRRYALDSVMALRSGGGDV